MLSACTLSYFSFSVMVLSYLVVDSVMYIYEWDVFIVFGLDFLSIPLSNGAC